MKTSTALMALSVSLAAGLPALAQPFSTVVGFDGGSNDGFQGNALDVPTGGNPGCVARSVGTIEFPSLRTGGVGEPSNPAFLGDYSSFNNITFSVDAITYSLTDFIGNDSVRSIGVTLINRDIVGTDGPAGVYFELGAIASFINPEWTTYSTTIADPTSATLPSGWIGFGSTNLSTFEPQLPDGTTFADILSNVTEFQISGAVPGFFYSPLNADYAIDNISVTVPAPASAALLGLGGLAATRRRR